MDFDNAIICFKSEGKYNIHSFWDLRRYLKTKIEHFERQGYQISQICEVKISFILDLRILTGQHFKSQPKSMLEWKLNEKLSRNPELIKTFENISYTLIRKFECMLPPEEI